MSIHGDEFSVVSIPSHVRLNNLFRFYGWAGLFSIDLFDISYLRCVMV